MCHSMGIKAFLACAGSPVFSRRCGPSQALVPNLPGVPTSWCLWVSPTEHPRTHFQKLPHSVG